MNFSKQDFYPILELAARLYAAIFISVYGSGKIIGGQFYRWENLPPEIAQTPVGELGSFDLAWVFFGYSFGYILFIGLSQLLGAFMLLFEKTKLLGVAILIPILLNIIVVDYFFQISWGALFAACSYFGALLFVLFYNREKVFETLKTMTDFESKKMPFKQRMVRIFLALLVVAIYFFFEQQMLNLLGR